MPLATSPYIKDGDFVLDENGAIIMSPDIQNEITIALTAYNCVWDYTINSELLPYLLQINPGRANVNSIKNIVTKALQPLISDNLLSNLDIAVSFPSLSSIVIKINVVDIEGNPIVLKWSNIQ